MFTKFRCWFRSQFGSFLCIVSLLRFSFKSYRYFFDLVSFFTLLNRIVGFLYNQRYCFGQYYHQLVRLPVYKYKAWLFWSRLWKVTHLIFQSLAKCKFFIFAEIIEICFYCAPSCSVIWCWCCKHSVQICVSINFSFSIF